MPLGKRLSFHNNPFGTWSQATATFSFHEGLSLIDWLQFEPLNTPVNIRIGRNTSVRLIEQCHQVHYMLEAGSTLFHFNACDHDYTLSFDNQGRLIHASGIALTTSCAVHSTVRLQAPQASLIWQESVHVKGNQHYQTTLLVDHQAPSTHTHCQTQSVVDDYGRFDLRCDLSVQANARQASVEQRNLNLITGPHGQVSAYPQLHILNRSITASHGTATQPLPADALWYLQSRGIPYAEATQLYLQGFLRSVFSTEFHELLIHSQPE